LLYGGEKRYEIEGGSQEMAVMVGQWQNFKNNNSGEFVLLQAYTKGQYSIVRIS